MRFIRFSDSIVPIDAITEIEARDTPCGTQYKIYLGFEASDGPAILEEKYYELVDDLHPYGDGTGSEARDARFEQLLALLNS